jgi:hypothetical protein
VSDANNGQNSGSPFSNNALSLLKSIEMQLIDSRALCPDLLSMNLQNVNNYCQKEGMAKFLPCTGVFLPLARTPKSAFEPA